LEYYDPFLYVTCLGCTSCSPCHQPLCVLRLFEHSSSGSSEASMVGTLWGWPCWEHGGVDCLRSTVVCLANCTLLGRGLCHSQRRVGGGSLSNQPHPHSHSVSILYIYVFVSHYALQVQQVYTLINTEASWYHFTGWSSLSRVALGTARRPIAHLAVVG
jgi:hypothetical protein